MVNWKNIAFWVMIIVIIILSVYIIHYTKTEGFKCVSNSGVYFIEGINKANNANTSCSCYIAGNKSFTGFTLDSSGVHLNSGVT